MSKLKKVMVWLVTKFQTAEHFCELSCSFKDALIEDALKRVKGGWFELPGWMIN